MNAKCDAIPIMQMNRQSSAFWHGTESEICTQCVSRHSTFRNVMPVHVFWLLTQQNCGVIVRRECYHVTTLYLWKLQKVNDLKIVCCRFHVSLFLTPPPPPPPTPFINYPTSLIFDCDRWGLTWWPVAHRIHGVILLLTIVTISHCTNGKHRCVLVQMEKSISCPETL